MPARAAPPEASRSSAGAAAAGTAAGVAGTAAPVVPPVGAALLTAAGLSALLGSFFGSLKDRNERWLRALYSGRPRAPSPGVPGALGAPEPGGVTQQDVHEAVAAENARESEYRRKALARIRPDVERILALRDPEKQRERLDALLRRERSYAESRAEAMALRALNAIDRAVLKRESPRGAVWNLGVRTVHTPGCVEASGKAWPWGALKLLAPPVHPQCGCWLSRLPEDVDPIPLPRALAEMRVIVQMEELEHA